VKGGNPRDGTNFNPEVKVGIMSCVRLSNDRYFPDSHPHPSG
jgi:hypothetical protein